MIKNMFLLVSTAALDRSVVVFDHHVLRFLSLDIFLVLGRFFTYTFPWRIDFERVYLLGFVIICS